jgi:hypothetical protein
VELYLGVYVEKDRGSQPAARLVVVVVAGHGRCVLELNLYFT